MGRVLRSIYLWVAMVTDPMRSWKGAEYINYVHVISFFVVMAIVTPGLYLLNANELNFTGLILLVAAMAISLERFQKMIGGSNTIGKSIRDILWSIVGGSLPPLLAGYLGFISWAY